MLKRFRSGNSSKKATPSVAAERPRLELSGPLLREALDSMIGVCDAGGGAERYVQALIFKSSIFKDAFSPDSGPMTLQRFLRLCMFLPTVRRKAHVYFTSERCDEILTALPVLLDDKVGFPERLSGFVAKFPDDKTHRWVRDLGAEILHNIDPERCPAMMRWVWDSDANSGVVREIWHGDQVDHITIPLDDGIETFLILREELAQYLTENGMFRDVLWYVDLLCGHIYARYLAAQGGTLLRTEFSNPSEDLGMHTRRILGLDGVRAKGDTARELERLESDSAIMKQLESIQEG